MIRFAAIWLLALSAGPLVAGPHVLVPAGEFIMGSGISVEEIARLLGIPKTRTLSIRTEHPQHRVRITQPFWIGKYEVTVQPILDKYCTKCHSGAKPKAFLNLTGDRTVCYNMSYMELTDKMLVHYTPGTGRTHAQPTNDCDEQAPLSTAGNSRARTAKAFKRARPPVILP